MADPERPNEASRCPECSYNLTGLPADGRCPECGFDYTGLLILYGWGSGERASATNVPRASLRWRIAILVSCFLLAVMLYLHGDSCGASVFFVLALPATAQLFRRLRLENQRLPLTQLRLTPQGYGQRDGFGPVALARWTKQTDFVIEKMHTKRYRLTIGEQTALDRFPSFGVELEFEESAVTATEVEEVVIRFLTAAGCDAWHDR